MINSHTIISFWFEEISPKFWWQKNVEFDETIKNRFAEIHKAAIHCELWVWRKQPLGRLAEIIILDQFSRNLYRDDALAFAYDPMALALAQEAVAQNAEQLLQPDQKTFLYMPYMHSESLLIHEEAVRLFNQPGLESNYEFELKHKKIIDRFGRYPHRNDTLDRKSTNEELAFLQEPGSSF